MKCDSNGLTSLFILLIAQLNDILADATLKVDFKWPFMCL